MSPGKHNEDILRDKTDETEILPAYALEDTRAGSSTQVQSSAAASRSAAAVQGPTITSPFDFPPEAPAPSYSESSATPKTTINRPIAIPQVSDDPTAPFLQAYAHSLLARGIPPDTWASFLDTLSAFLAAKVTDRAISHAADIAKQFGNVPKRFGKNVATHAKSIGRGISDKAKKGNIVGAAFGIIGGAITLPISTAVNAVEAITSLPSTAVVAVTQKPQTPRERALVYTAVANKKWFEPRGLYARLMDTPELAQLLGLANNHILQAALSEKSADADTQLGPLRTHISDLTIDNPTRLKLGEKTLWLVIQDSNNQ
ncbi:hypothetical protein PFICI_13780 [Pestalotiopsis fici W106-1]|uniref:Uncharacterized protein n=1 Tax=Pestalotiopsis fici (strain W106-1 / CGMCC3.15140) TaxID=1229662 RepID=W3WJH0_PESFW|nr:uncharacterized protein PFICI_13780 [Pestalotiopsis fici W106-1]ETS73914.1 hypothetical protein PFICI_13780 [Pestalotiopsis fici W106-1]